MSVAPPTVATAHVLRLAEPVTARQILRPVVPAGAFLWLVGTAVEFGTDGSFTSDPTVAVILGLWDDDETARAVLDSPGIVWGGADDSIEAWHAGLRPYRTRGEANWLDGPMVAPTGDAPHPDAPVLTVTSTAFSDDPSKALALGRAMHEVQASAEPDGRLRTVVSLGAKRDDGRTLTLWRSQSDATAWAYRSSPHREMITRQQREELMPRSSFTRFAVERAHGTWGGADPFA